MLSAARKSSSFLRCASPILNPLQENLSFSSPIHLPSRPKFFNSPPNPTKSPVFIPPLSLLRGGCYDDNRPDLPKLPICPGCGVHMQNSDPDLPGFFVKPSNRQNSSDLDELKIPNSLKIGEIEEKSVCARCHSLRHYGRVKNSQAENLLPDFDFDRTVGPKIISFTGSRSVVLIVVDLADFDGSFPKRIAKLLNKSIEENSLSWKEGKSGNVPRVLIVVTKIDLLPGSLSPTGLEYWVRNRVHEGGINKISGVHLVSSVKGWGVKNLLEHVEELVGKRGNVWAVGAQNAGKSTLINAMGRFVGGKISVLTEAPVPGTTIGIVRVDGILSGQIKLFDTPGIIHSCQISSRLTAEEQALIHVKKELRPRTYRIKAGYSVHVAGLMRLDVEETTVDSIYLTVWASPLLPLHMGKTESASGMIERHFGRQLKPPISEDRVVQLGQWLRREFRVSGNSWDVSSVDIAASGLGWIAVGLKGEAVLGAWTYEGVDLVLRSSLIPSRAKIFEVNGFTVSKIVSEADSASGQLKKKRGKKDGLDPEKHITRSTVQES